MLKKLLMLQFAAVFAVTQSHAGSREIRYGPAAAWVTSPPMASTAKGPEGAPVRFAYVDRQSFLSLEGDENYSAYRVKILSPQGLAAGNVVASWNPSSDELVIHKLNLIHSDQVINVLESNKFQVIQRENNLEYSILDGILTASLQIPGLQVGDEIEFAGTIHHRDPTLGARSSGLVQLPVMGSAMTFRELVRWPVAKQLSFRVTPDLVNPVIQRNGDEREIEFELRDPTSSVPTDGAPPRFIMRRFFEYSDFSDWAQVSHLLWPLFNEASQLGPNSPVKVEADKIAATTASPVTRTEAALRLVEDRIRYVYVGLDGGNYRPVSADETWKRRFGDCKAKTALLLALLNSLGVKAEAVLVNSKGGDVILDRLPTPAMYDHVLVHVELSGVSYWLDATRLGDHALSALPQADFGWTLPLRPGPVSLVNVKAEAPRQPLKVEVVRIDASAGFDARAKVHLEEIDRGDVALQLHTQMAALSPDDLDRVEKAAWRQKDDWAEPATVFSRYDDVQNILVWGMDGDAKLKWTGDSTKGHSFNIPNAGFTPPNEIHRPKEQDQTAPWSTDFPLFSCWVTDIRLPPETAKRKWDFLSAPVNVRLGGIEYWREAAIKDGVMRTVMSKRSLVHEITAVEAQRVNDRLPDFDNAISQVYEIDGQPISRRQQSIRPEPLDWSIPTAPCGPPS